MNWFIFGAIWGVCGFIAWGVWISSMQYIWRERPDWQLREFPRHKLDGAIFCFPLGAIALLVMIICGDMKYGLQYFPKKPK